jgi:hypothetical protein
VFEDRARRRMFEPKRDEVVGGWKTLQNEELHNMCALSHIVIAIKSSRMRWAGHKIHMGGMKNEYNLK